MAREKPPICQTCGTALTVQHLIADDCLMYKQERAERRIPHNLDTALGPDYEKNVNIIDFIKQTQMFNCI